MNKIYLQGIVSNISYCYEFNGEKFYSFELSTSRFSGVVDTLNCVTSEYHLQHIEDGKTIGICGEVRTRNVEVDGKRHLEIYVFVKETGSCGEDNTNYFELQGFIRKQPKLRETPLGRMICDVFISTHRENGKSDYIPCIFWGRQALRVAEMEVGKEISITGRLQSREYVKHNLFGECETKTAYELSVVELKGVEE